LRGPNLFHVTGYIVLSAMAIPTPDQTYLPGLPRYLSFVDESGHSHDPKRNCLCLAGLIAKEDAWRAFDAEWRAACQNEGLTEPFHMMYFAARKREFKGWTEERRRRLLGNLITVIWKAQAIPIGSVAMVRGPDALSERSQKHYRDAHFIAFQPLTYHIAVAANMMDPREQGLGPVTMVYAHHPEHSNGLASTRKLWDAMRENNRIVASVMQSYVSETPKDCTPLQAADLWAYELGHHFERIRPEGRPPRWAFQQFVKMGLNYSFTHNFLTYHGASGVNGIGQMARVQHWQEISLYRPGFISRIPPGASGILGEIARGQHLRSGPPAR
jgi:Protein of unknown function (DUF3800)